MNGCTVKDELVKELLASSQRVLDERDAALAREEALQREVEEACASLSLATHAATDGRNIRRLASIAAEQAIQHHEQVQTLKARAEQAEAERDGLRKWWLQTTAERDAFEARVAELERQLDTFETDFFWKCFHCGAEFTEEQHEMAARHFGAEGSKFAVCQVENNALKARVAELEAQNARAWEARMETVKLKGRLEIAHDEMNSHIRWRHEVQADRNYYKAEAERLRAALIRMMDAPYHPKVGECEAARKQAREALAAPAAETAQATETGAREEYDVDSRTVSVYPAEAADAGKGGGE